MLDFAEKNGGAIIPVELVSFDATARAKNVDVIWTTASEYRTDRFEIERADLNDKGKSLFNRIASVKAAGNSSEVKNYGFVDSDVEFGKTYVYRLRMVDLDGKSEFSEEKIVEVSENGIWLSEAIPNPATNRVVFQYTGKPVDMNIVMIDLNGKNIVPSFQLRANEIELDLSTFSSGNYTLVIKAGDVIVKRQFTVVK
jgi:hypothetical protein